MFNKNKSYMSIHNHSVYSNTRFGDAINIPEEMPDKFHNKGLVGFALTDHQSLSGHPALIKAMQNKKKQSPHFFDNFKPLLGDEIYLVDKNKMNDYRKADKLWHNDRRAFWDAQNAARIPWKEQKRFTRPYPYPHFYHFIMVANNNNGYKILQKLNRDAWTHSFRNGKGYKMKWRQQRLPTYKDDLAKLMQGHKGDLTVSTACLGSETSHDILSGNHKDMYHFLTYLDKTFGKNNTYFELMPNKRPKKRYMAKVRKMVALQKQNDGRLPQKYQNKYGRYTEFNQWYVNKNLVNIAKKTGHKYIISTDSHFTDSTNEHMHAKLLKAESPDRKVRPFYHYAHMFRPDELKNYFSPDVLKNASKSSREIMNKVHHIDPKVILGNKRQQVFTSVIGLKSLNVTQKMSNEMLQNLRRSHKKITNNVKHLRHYLAIKKNMTEHNLHSLEKSVGKNYVQHIEQITKPATDNPKFISRAIRKKAMDKVNNIFKHHSVNTSHHSINQANVKMVHTSLKGLSKKRLNTLETQNKFIQALKGHNSISR